MANTYTQIYIHVVFAVQYREAAISNEWREVLHRYITGIVTNKGQKLISINSMPDHIHIFIGMHPDIALSDLVRDIKRDSTNFINSRIIHRRHFAWQKGFGAFSYSHSQLQRVVAYIRNQQYHHRKSNFHVEYEEMLKAFAVKYDSIYLFQDYSKENR
jgi:REP element-mobilizing transposase RayT